MSQFLGFILQKEMSFHKNGSHFDKANIKVKFLKMLHVSVTA
jgi:hypothetical protein